jgi:CDP-diacylglycerol--glycerol-3-phosphate 3-phosphatidyltransferase
VYGVLLFLDGGTDPWWRFWAWVVFALAAVTDGVDGKLARRRGEITNFGKVADPIADKALTGTAFIGLSLLGVVWWWVTIVILVREIGITVLRFVIIRHGVMPAGRGGKLKTMLQTLSLGALTFPLWVLPFGQAWTYAAYVILGAALVMTVVSGVDYVFKAARLRETSDRTRERRAARAAHREAQREARREAHGGTAEHPAGAAPDPAAGVEHSAGPTERIGGGAERPAEATERPVGAAQPRPDDSRDADSQGTEPTARRD